LPLAAATLIAAQPFARAAVRYRIAVGGFAMVAAVAPLCALATTWRIAPAGTAPAPAAALSALLPLLLAAAAAVSAGLLLGLVRDVIRLRRIKRRAVPLGVLDVRNARLGSSPKVDTPTAIGYVHPAVVIPEGFGARVDGAEWAAIVAHECAHLSRGDDWAKAVQSAMLRAGWWLPGLWILSRALDLERELASDERAATESGARRYAACLLRLATDRWTDALAPGLWNRRSHVTIRVERLIRPVRAARPLVRAISLGAATAAAFAIVMTAVLAVPGSAPPAAVTVARIAPAVHHAAHRVARIVARLHHPAHAGAHVVSWAGTAGPAAPSAPVRTVAQAEPHAVPVAPQAAPVAPQPAPVAPQPAPGTPHAAPARPPARRAEAHRAPPEQASPTVVAFVPHHTRCTTCFGPWRTAEDTIPTPAPAFGGHAEPAAIAAPDPASGPVDLGSGMAWYRLPTRAVSLP
jgi:beta-lactamase regulating signal transducer with metallopeptidase domain